MPLSRYQIRNEYSLADPELYRAADKDDPEALLEGVAMAGLVGVLRQLGDLAEFAAEIFHDLHEEVMATAARGHGLMARVQQLEAEFPLIEKALLTRTDHSILFHNTGVDWHPNLPMDQNLISGGDLPRFVMDCYEECRGPPQLFLLDKFDTAGAGACLKRYTDPSFFKVEKASSGIVKLDIQRDKKIRKVKKKGSRWRNGETPEVTSHAKLHQLFLEERVQNGNNDPARHVQLKRRQLNGFPLDSRTEKSYMEKFLVTSSPERKAVREISVSSLPLELTSNITYESGHEILEIGTVSPNQENLQRKRSPFSSPNMQETEQKLSMEELSGDITDRETLKALEPHTDGQAIPFTHHKVVEEKEVTVIGESKTEGSIDGYHSDDITSEIDNYMDALTTMESEIETDSDYRHKSNMRFLHIEKHGTDSDANEEPHELRPRFSDSLSFGNSSTSDDGNSSFKKGRYSFSCSDTLSNLTENMPSDGDGVAKVFPSTDFCVAEIDCTSSNRLSVGEENLESKSHEPVESNGTYVDLTEMPTYRSERGEISASSCLTDSNPMHQSLDPGASLRQALSVEPELDEVSSDSAKLCIGFSNTDENSTNMGDDLKIITNASDVPSETREDFTPPVSAETQVVGDLVSREDPNSFPSLLHMSNVSDLPPEKKSSDDIASEMLQPEPAGSRFTENLVNGANSFPSPTEEQPQGSALRKLQNCLEPEQEVPDSLAASIACYPVVVEPDGIISEVDTSPAAGVNSESLTAVVDEEVDVAAHEEVDVTAHGVNSDNFTLADNKVDASTASGVNSENLNSVVNNIVLATPVSGVNSENSTVVLDTEDATPAAEIHPENSTVMVDNTMDGTPAGGVNLDTTTTVLDTPSYSFSEQQWSKITDDVPSLELASEVGVLYPGNQKNLQGVSTAADDGENGGSTNSGDTMGGNNIPLEFPSNYSAVVAASAALCADGNGAKDDVDDVTRSSDLMCSPSMNSRYNEDSHGFWGHKKDLDIDEAISPECLLESEAQTELNTSMNSRYSEDSHGFWGHKKDLDIDEAISPECLLESEAQTELNTSMNSRYSEDSHGFWGHKKDLDIDEAISPECLLESEAQTELSQLATAPTNSNSRFCNAVSQDKSNSELINDAPYSSLTEQIHEDHLGDAVTAPTSSKQADLDLETRSPGKSHNEEDMEDARSSTYGYLPEPEIPSKESLDLLENESDMEGLHRENANSMKLNLQSVQVQPLDHMDQEICSDASPKSCAEDVSSQPSAAELLPQSVAPNLESSEQSTESIFPGFVLPPKSSQKNIEEVPPLPPLPPMQWRVGKLQNAPLSSEKETMDYGLNLFPQMPQSITADENTQGGFPALGGRITKPQSPFLPESTVEEETSQLVFENPAGKLEQSSSLATQMPIANHDDKCEHELETQPSNHFLTLPAMSDEQTQHASLALEGAIAQHSSIPFSAVSTIEDASPEHPTSFLEENEVQPLNHMEPETGLEDKKLQQTSAMVHPSLIPFSPISTVEDTTPTRPPSSLEQNAVQLLNHIEPETSLEDKKLQQTSQISAVDKVNCPETFGLPSSMDAEQLQGPQHMLLSPEGEMVCSSSTSQLPGNEDGKPNGKPSTKIPRPQDRLIEAVAAHDKSKLKKVTERIRPQIRPKLEQRDSLLEQIRTRSFNLRPASATRPIIQGIQGPKTNLKVAAILEKANAIRQVDLSLSLSLSGCVPFLCGVEIVECSK
ncbi:protein SCAR2 isoform X2 [Malania oleifera]|uniref:protein SCAR2 isoform X2 n=1 Tax=Malania oleifera TaxID=397392 RepID=UPI0025ADEBA4|nr:protein SCAR2 isoform X2 [Malania oleifera]